MRRKHDFYETPPHYVKALQNVIGMLPEASMVIEPCVGDGQLLRLLKAENHGKGLHYITNDINPRRTADFCLDATKRAAWRTMCRGSRPDWCITNPPFRHELAILRRALHHCDAVAMLARLSFLEPTNERRPFWATRQGGCEVIVLPRYSFVRKNGRRTSDTMTCCWLVFRGGDLDFPSFHVACNREQR